MKSNLAWILPCSLLLACGGSSLEGTVEGVSLGKLGSAFFMTESGNLEVTKLMMTTFEGGCETYCSYFRNQATPSGEEPLAAVSVDFSLFESVTTGTYPIVPDDQFLPDSPPEEIHARFYQWVGNGWEGPGAETGSVEITEATADLLKGTLEITFTTGDAITGQFEASRCGSTPSCG